MLRRIVLAGVVALSALSAAGVAYSQDVDDDPGYFVDPSVARNGQGRQDRLPGLGGDVPDEQGADWGREGVLPPRIVIGGLYRRGYREVEVKRLRGSSYVIEAETPRGNRVLLVVDGRDNEITGMRVLDWQRPRRNWDDGGWAGASPWNSPRW